MSQKRTVILNTEGSASESRTGKRFPLELPIVIRNQDSSHPEQALTIDLSASGVYIQANSRMHVGTTIEFEISLPAEVVGTESDVSIKCKGRVVRMEENDETGAAAKHNGVGCVIDQYEFVRKDKDKEKDKDAKGKATS